MKTENETEISNWSHFNKNIQKYQKSDLRKSIWQILDTLVAYIGLWVLIVISASISWWLSGLFIIATAGFSVRLFIIFHDCGHGSFFKSQRANKIVGMSFGILAFTPCHAWQNQQ